jgi:hypothetical protein
MYLDVRPFLSRLTLPQVSEKVSPALAPEKRGRRLQELCGLGFVRVSARAASENQSELVQSVQMPSELQVDRIEN